MRAPSARCTETKSLSRSSSSFDPARRTPTSAARSAVRLLLQATTSMSKASPTRATRAPIFPSPSRPSRRPARSAPTVLCHGPPLRSAVLSSTSPRASPSSSAQVSSTGGVDELAVPHTVTPWARAAAWSITEFRIPEATSSRSRGSRSNTSAGKAIRSRSVTTMSKSATAATSSSTEAGCSRNGTTSTRSATGAQSAIVVATPWKSSSTAQRSVMPRTLPDRPGTAGSGSRAPWRGRAGTPPEAVRRPGVRGSAAGRRRRRCG